MLVYVVLFLVVVMIWEGSKAIFAIPDYKLPHLAQIVEAFFRPTPKGPTWQILLIDAAYTMLEAVTGFVVGGITGFLFAVLFVHVPVTRRGLLPFVIASQTVPIIAIAPMIFIPAAAGVMWAFAYTEHYGWVNHILMALGLQAYPWMVSDAAFFLVMVTDIWGWTPFIYLILLAALQSLPQEPIEAARVDGANAWQVFRHVTFPLLKPVIVIALTIKTLDTYRAFDYLWIMTNGGPGTSSTTLNLATYKTAFQNLDFGKASALAVITMVFPLTVMILFLAFRRRQAQ